MHHACLISLRYVICDFRLNSASVFKCRVQDEVLEDAVQHWQAAVKLAQEQQLQYRRGRRRCMRQDNERAEQRQHHSSSHEKAAQREQGHGGQERVIEQHFIGSSKEY